MLNKLKLSFLMFIFVFISASYADDIGTSKTGSGDIENCAQDLEQLQLAVRDATDQATEARANHEEREHCKHELDHTNLQGEDCDEIKIKYQNQVNDLESELQNVGRQLAIVENSCGYNFSAPGSKK